MKEYLKGKDIKQQGDCLCHCFIKKIEFVTSGTTHTHRNQIIQWYDVDGYHIKQSIQKPERPEGFEKW